MKLGNWLMCHANAYAYFGGVTWLLIPDNLKTGVTQNTRYETVLNRNYQEMAEHYDTAIVPACQVSRGGNRQVCLDMDSRLASG